MTSDDPHEGWAVLDEYVALGGDVLDTAAAYGGGDSERLLGEWLERSGVPRESLVVVTKGAHPDGNRRRVTEADIAADLGRSVERLRGPVDVYLLHRDDPAVPAGEIVEWLNEHRRSSLVRAFGTSNWTTGRIDEANAYAAANGLEGFCVSSQHLSLATQNEEHWPDTQTATDPAVAAWHERTQMPLLAWSAQARGYFAGRDGPDVRRVYDNAANRERRERARAAAARTGRSAQQLALAWVLQQPYPVFAAFGARTPEQVREAWGALAVEPSEVEALAA